MKHHHAATVILCMFLTAGVAVAHQDAIPPLQHMEKVYSAPAPLGEIRLTYTAPLGDAPARLSLRCDLFEKDVPAEGLADLPRPNWSDARVVYSLTSFDPVERWVDRPYVYISIPAWGPAGQPAWERTWLEYHFDHQGNLTRRLKRMVDRETHIRVHWPEWHIGSPQTAAEILEAEERRDR